MPSSPPAQRYSFGVFEADAATGELRRAGMRVRLHAQPFQVLLLLLSRPGELLTREDISRELWPDGTFVDYEHGVNSAVNRLRDALGDKAANPRFVETLARKGYRFIAPVQRVDLSATEAPATPASPVVDKRTPADPIEPGLLDRVLATPADLPATPHRLVRALFVLLQVMYLCFYVGALANLGEIGELLAPLRWAPLTVDALIFTAALLIPARIFLVSAVLFRAPGLRRKFLTMWPALLLMDIAWALAPFLLMHHIPYGLALACMAALVYSPFAQRALMLMGVDAAAANDREA